MENTFQPTPKTAKEIRLIAYYQIVGAGLGILFSGLFLFYIPLTSVKLIIYLGIPFCFFAFSIYAGYLLLKNDYSRGLQFSSINQWLQCVSFSLGGLTYLYTAGFSLMLNVYVGNAFGINLSPGLSSYDFSYSENGTLFIVGVNFAAIFLIGFISKLKRKLVDEELHYNTTLANSIHQLTKKQ